MGLGTSVLGVCVFGVGCETPQVGDVLGGPTRGLVITQVILAQGVISYAMRSQPSEFIC